MQVKASPMSTVLSSYLQIVESCLAIDKTKRPTASALAADMVGLVLSLQQQQQKQPDEEEEDKSSSFRAGRRVATISDPGADICFTSEAASQSETDRGV